MFTILKCFLQSTKGVTFVEIKTSLFVPVLLWDVRDTLTMGRLLSSIALLHVKLG
jgi:hypothetical protein